MSKPNIEKKVESSSNLSQNQFEILYNLSNFLTVTQIAKNRKTSRQAVYKSILILLEKGMIEKIDSTYRLTELGKKGLHSFIGFTYKLRQHNISYKIQVLESQTNWDKKREELIEMPFFNKKVKLKNNNYELFNFGKVKIKTTTKSVIIRLPELFDNSVEGAIIQSMDLLYQILPKIENRFKIRLRKDNKANITLISQEYARLNDCLAKLYKVEGNKLYITDDYGKVWLIADYSFCTNELETIDTRKADEDMITVSNFMNDLRNNPVTLSQLTSMMYIQNQQISNVTENQLMFAKNIETHMQVLSDIKDSINELTRVIKKINIMSDHSINKSLLEY